MPDAGFFSDTFGTQYYATKLGGYDEMYAASNKALPYWERFMGQLEAMGGDNLELRRREAQRLLRDNGVTYNIYGDAQKLARPWRLDPIPLLIGNDEWRVIEAGLKQRAELFNLILKDIYGPRLLLKKGWLPSELIFGHEGFLHPCVGALPDRQRPLAIYSANLARGPDGRMWVLDDRTQAPSGSGYALENRTVMARVLPDILRATPVHRLSGFFKALRIGLAELAPHDKEDPRIVVLTPGPLNETYFEHAYLAAYLGYTLVQGDDLTVRDGRVWLRSLTGLQPVDVILRRVDDSFCDPLELLSHSRLGTAGLLEAARRGNVAIANPLGSSILENPALLAFLPRLSLYFLNEELKLPSVATWWCGQRRECEFVLHNLDRLVIKPVNRSAGNHAVFGGALSDFDKQELRRRIAAKPHLFVGQERVSFSTLPSFIDHQIVPRNAVLRNFAVASGDGYVVLPGGLTRIARQKDDIVVSNQAGGLSKDTWVLASEPAGPAMLWTRPGPRRRLEPISDPLTSRAADNLFWAGRHVERIEASARLLRTILFYLTDIVEFKELLVNECMAVLLPALTQVTGTYPGFLSGGIHLIYAPETELLALARDNRRLGSLAANIQAFGQTAFTVRDLWPQEAWRAIDTIQRRWQQRVVDHELTVEQLQNQLHELITVIAAFTGLIGDNMMREAAWLMLDSGRRLERALALMALLRSALVVQYADGLQTQVLEAVLAATGSLAIYQRRYRSYIQLPMVLELLLLDESYPRSVVHQLRQLSNHVAALPRGKPESCLSVVERLILKAYTDLRLADVLELSEVSNGAGHYGRLDGLLVSITDLLRQLSDAIAEAYFSHSQTARLMMLSAAEDEL